MPCDWFFHKHLIRGQTVIYGKCLQVGGRKATVKLARDEDLTVRVSRSLAKAIAACLYEEIGLQGEALWDPESRKIVKFKATRLLPYRETTPLQAIETLRSIAGKDWDRIENPDQFLKNLRTS